VIEVPGAKLAVHVPEAQFIPAGLELTLPVPETVTDKVKEVTKVAPTDTFDEGTKEQIPEPEQPPVHPANAQVAEGTAASATLVLLGNGPEQVPEQGPMPDGLENIFPEPVTVTVAVLVVSTSMEALIGLMLVPDGGVTIAIKESPGRTEYDPERLLQKAGLPLESEHPMPESTGLPPLFLFTHISTEPPIGAALSCC
jgi:hypothetical protein